MYSTYDVVKNVKVTNEYKIIKKKMYNFNIFDSSASKSFVL